MDKKSVLTSIIALGFVTPAIADFPADGLMKANQVYTGAAIHENMGVYEGTVYANAVYEEAVYELLAGTYLPQSSTSGATCDSGYYCPGGSYRYSTSGNQGIYQCSGEFNNSDSGATSVNDCYKVCSVADFPHAATVTGHDYYAFGPDTCEPATCVQGWHIVNPSGSNADNAIRDSFVLDDFQNFESEDSESSGSSIDALCSGYSDTNGYLNYMWNDQVADNHFSGIDSSAREAIMATIVAPSFWGLGSFAGNEPGLWSVGYTYLRGFFRGTARLSSVSGAPASGGNPPTTKTTSELGAEGGNNCYCNITGYRPWDDASGPTVSNWLAAKPADGRNEYSWVYAGIANSLGACAQTCAWKMSVVSSGETMNFRLALLGTVKAAYKSHCAANNITINWSGTTTAEINANQARTAIYGGDIRTPRSATPVEGKIFKGWEFVSGTQGE